MKVLKRKMTFTMQSNFTEPVARVMEITITSRGEVLQPSTVGSHGFEGD